MTREEATLRMRLLGFGPASEPETVALAAGERATLRRSLAAGRCAVFGALGSPGVDALALRLRAGGDLLAADVSGRPFAFAAHCAEQDLGAVLELTAEAGSGTATVLGFDAPREAVPEWAGPPLGITSDQREPAAIESRITSQLDSAGYGPGSTVLEAPTAATGDRHRIEPGLPGSGCGILAVFAGPGVEGLVLETRPLPDPPVRVLGDEGRPALVSLCATDQAPPAVELAVIKGSGPLRAVFHPLPRVPLPAGIDDPPLALREAAAIFARHGMEAADELPLPAAISGTAWAAPFTAGPGRCFGFAAARRDAVAVSVFRLTDGAGRELHRWIGPAAPALLVRCVHGAPEELVLEVDETGPGADAEREPPVVVVFSVEAAAAIPLVAPR
jgi:hypothetical protein